jgi:sugar lactone lactonase YvrE
MPNSEWEDFFTMDGPGGADGSVVDSEGFVWNARWGAGKAIRISPDGKLDKEVLVPGVTRVSCPAFGGKDMKTLFLTTAREHMTPQEEIEQPTAGGVFAIELDVPGIAEPFFKP